MIKKTKLWMIIITVCSLLESCFVISDYDTNEYYLRGKIIDNYPEWINCRLHEIGVSDWKEWQSDQGKLLHDYVDDKIISDDFQGKFRLEVSDQDVSVFFNDSKFSCYVLFLNWVKENTSSSNPISIPQDDIENEFVYDCWIKRTLRDSTSDNNKSHITIQRVVSNDPNINCVNYIQTVAGRKIIDMELKIFMGNEKIYLDKTYDWLPYKVDINYAEGIDYIQDNVIKLYMGYGPSLGLNNNFYYKSFFYCPEGFTLKSVDEENKSISLNYLDADKSDFLDYLTIKISEDGKTADISYYKKSSPDKPVKVEKDIECLYR